jgi:predicted amidohydrolase YtcJ
LTNGRIYTMAEPGSMAGPSGPGPTTAGVGPVVDSLVVRDGRIVFAGRRDDVNLPAGEAVVDLGGRAVLPGLVDGHGHLIHLARLRLRLDVGAATSEEHAAGLVRAASATRAAGEWVLGRGWDQNRWPEARFPSRASLDRASPRHPVALVRIDGHAIWANALALQAAGIDAATRDPEGGRVVKGADGQPTGLLVDTAQRLLEPVLPRESTARLDVAVREAIDHCLSLGLTGLHEMGVDEVALDAYRRLVERDDFPFRNHVAVRGTSESAWRHYRERGPETLGDGRVAVAAIKLMADGALGSRGAALHDPYCDDPHDPGNRGLILLPREEIERFAREATAAGFQVCVHAIGDRANTLVLDALESVLATDPRARALRPRIEHAQLLRPDDIPRFRRLGVVPSMQPTHCTSDMPWAPSRLGRERLDGAYAWRSLLRSGVVIAGGSDFPVESPNPFLGIFAAVARRPVAGPDPGWSPTERMTRAEAVRAFTIWNARAIGRDADTGSLEPGKRADLVVCSQDVFACDEAAIAEIRPVLTLVDGRVAFVADPGLFPPAPARVD